MKAIAWIVCIFLVFSLGVLMAGCEKPDKDQIREVVNGSAKAYESEDLDKFMTYLTEDCERIVNFTEGEPIQIAGQEAIKAALANDFKNWDDIKMILTGGQDKWSAGVGASVRDYEHSMTNIEKGIREVVKGKINMNLKKIDGVWKITKIENTIDSWEPVEE